MKKKNTPGVIERLRKVLLSGLIWCVVCSPILAVLTAETWIHLQIFHDDYVKASLNRKLRELEEQRNKLTLMEAQLKNFSHLDTQAAKLKMVEPYPGQIEVIDLSGKKLSPHPWSYARLAEIRNEP